MASVYAGWILFGLGVLMYLLIIVQRFMKLISSNKEGVDFGPIEKTADAIAKLAEAFSKFSEDIQFLLLGTGCLAVGIYLLTNKPF